MSSTTYRKQNVTRQIDENIWVFGGPVWNDSRLLNGQVVFGPREIRKQIEHLFMGAQLTGDKLSGAEWIWNRRNNQRQNARVQKTTRRINKCPIIIILLVC